MKRFLAVVALLFLVLGTADAQKVAVKTNSLYWLTTTPNAGFEFALGDRWTFEIAGGYNPWTLNKEDNIKAKHFLVTPEFRYWFCESFQGHFIGINANYTQFNAGGIHVPEVFYKVESLGYFLDMLQYSRSQGWAVGAGLTYGYAFPIARRWNMEFNLGLGWWYTQYDRFESRTCGLFQERIEKHAFGLTDLGISFIYMIK
ncbi:MAG: DUF3575 domain-containing protein [Bacteroidales bacterium]|mgnify:FL=1|nr:DUF3575 domain-containing protein [Bacteroidales bacterium]